MRTMQQFTLQNTSMNKIMLNKMKLITFLCYYPEGSYFEQLNCLYCRISCFSKKVDCKCNHYNGPSCSPGDFYFYFLPLLSLLSSQTHPIQVYATSWSHLNIRHTKWNGGRLSTTDVVMLSSEVFSNPNYW